MESKREAFCRFVEQYFCLPRAGIEPPGAFFATSLPDGLTLELSNYKTLFRLAPVRLIVEHEGFVGKSRFSKMPQHLLRHIRSFVVPNPTYQLRLRKCALAICFDRYPISVQEKGRFVRGGRRAAAGGRWP